jgi:type III secretion system YscD/HrpQ family protein
VLSLIPEKMKQVSLPEIAKILQVQVADMNYLATVSVTLDKNQLIVDGVVPTNMEQRELRSALATTYAGIQFNVRSGERIIGDIEDAVRSVSPNLRVTPLQPGVYSIAGYVYNADAWAKVRNQLILDVPGVKKIQNDVMTPDKILTLASATLSQFALSQQVTISVEPQRIFFQGKISVLQLDAWKKASDEILKTFGGLIPVEFDVQTISAQAETASNSFFPLPIQSISISSGGLSWVTTSDGKKYFSGSFLPSGWRIDEVTIDGLKLSREGKQISMHLEALE